ncbi:hypothetical protein ABFT23_20455 [Nocardioides sp. C4-1]|uniref:hypothetical protein n=1 Tax=Nocardioides sp. C4-1 TaxID=3151851 RepID=UPI0032665857
MNPLAARLKQPDQRSCGAASVTMAAALADPAYADRVAVQESFGREVLRRHRELTSFRPEAGWQVPWPRFIGTPPWAVARALTAITGRRHRTRLVRFRTTVRPVERLSAVYVGSALLPRHVVLVVDPGAPGSDDAVRVYDPARGRVVDLTDFRRWTTRWFAVTPSRPSTPRSPA